MNYVYLLYSQTTKRFYVGFTTDLKKRFTQHNAGKSIATKAGVPWELLYYEAYSVKKDAIVRETKLKHHGKGLSELKRRVTLDER